MTTLIKCKIRSTDVELLTAILDVLTPAQVLQLVDEIRKIEGFGNGRITLVINCGKLRFLQPSPSYDFRGDDS
jgi:hypothetical protein